MSKEVDPRRARRRAVAKVLMKLQHAVPGVVLIQEGVQSLREGVEGWHRLLAVSEVLVCVAVFVSLARVFPDLARDIRRGTVPHIHLGIDWVDIFLGGMLFTEAWAKYLDHGHVARPTILLGLVMIIFGVFGGRYVAWRTRVFEQD